MENVAIKKNDFMRAVYFHKLNVHCTSYFHGNSLDTDWKLNGEWVATTHVDNFEIGIMTDETCECSQEFYKAYVLTTPDDMYHCATCKYRGHCNFEREDTEEFCFGWKNK
jgi:hypothetical protein